MQKQKGISTLVGIIIIVTVAVVAFGGVFAFQYFTPESQPVIQPQQVQKQQILDRDFPLAGEPTDQTAGWKTYASTQLGISFSYPKNWGNVIENNNGYNGYYLTFGFPDQKDRGENSGTISIREATADELFFLNSSKTKENNNGVKFYINDYIAKGNWLDRVYAFKNQGGETILIWFNTNRDAGIPSEAKNQKIFEEINEYQNFNQMLSTFKFTK